MQDYWRIDKDLVSRICGISSLKLSEEETERFVSELNDVLEAFREVERVDTEGVSPAYHPLRVENVFREDIERRTEWDPLSNSRQNENRYIKGPKLTG